MMAKAGRPLGVKGSIQRRSPLSPDFHRTWQERSRWNLSALTLGPCNPFGTFGQSHWPAHDVILELVVGDLVLAGPNLAAHRHAGCMHRVGIARNQRMPPIEIMAIGHQAIAAGR